MNVKALDAKYKDWIAKNQMENLLKQPYCEEMMQYIRSDYRKKSFIGDGGTAEVRRFEIATGLNCGRGGKSMLRKQVI